MSLKLEDVTYTYSPGTAYEMHALEHINLEFPNGQFVGIIGHTGSGKSTLVQHLNGLIRPTAGRVLYNGEDIWKEGYPLRELRCDHRCLLRTEKSGTFIGGMQKTGGRGVGSCRISKGNV